MNTLDLNYQNLLTDIISNGVNKEDRTGTGTISVFGRQIRHNMKDGFPLLTTKKMAWKSVVTELLWFLRGDTNNKYLFDNGCNIWTWDAHKNYLKEKDKVGLIGMDIRNFLINIARDDEFAKRWGELGPVYGKQWRNFNHPTNEQEGYDGVDQIANLINELKTNPDSRRLIVNAWNVGELDQMVLPPCHYSFQVYTRELSLDERTKYKMKSDNIARTIAAYTHQILDNSNIPTRAISLMWNQRSVDTFLGLPFNIASYGLLLEIIAKVVNMVPDELIGNLGDVHLYSNHIEQAKEQISRELSLEERRKLWESTGMGWKEEVSELLQMQEYNCRFIPKRTREPYPLPTLNINTEFWPYEGGECGVGPLDAVKVFESFKDDNFCKCLLEEDIQLGNYQSHPAIKAELSN